MCYDGPGHLPGLGAVQGQGRRVEGLAAQVQGQGEEQRGPGPGAAQGQGLDVHIQEMHCKFFVMTTYIFRYMLLKLSTEFVLWGLGRCADYQ